MRNGVKLEGLATVPAGRGCVPLLASTLFVLAAPLAGQCQAEWGSWGSLGGCNGAIHSAVAWDPDGAGPAGALWVVGGTFTVIGTITANRIAAFDPTTSTWSAFGSGIDGAVNVLQVAANGDLFVGGQFSSAGGSPANCIARWNGTNWSSVGGGVTGSVAPRVSAMALTAQGDLIVGGQFWQAGGVATNHVARWSNGAWQAMPGLDLFSSFANDLVVRPNGDIVVCGWLGAPGGVARWNGSSWTSLGALQAPIGWPWPIVDPTDLVLLSNGDVALYGNNIASIGGTPITGMGRWNGSTWSSFGPGWPKVDADGTLPNGNVVFGFNSSNSSAATWNGAMWSALPNLPFPVCTFLATGGGSPVAVNRGSFGGPLFATLVGGSWVPVGPGTDLVGPVNAAIYMANGDLIVAGQFSNLGGATPQWIARRVGSTWQPLGLGVDGPAKALLELPNGELIVGGSFLAAGGIAANNIARWNGSSWSALGTGMTAVPGSVPPLGVQALVRTQNGDVIAGGEFATAGGVVVGNIARWNGVAWSPLGAGLTFGLSASGTVKALTVRPSGNVVAGGMFFWAGTAASWLAEWNGSSWAPIGPGSPNNEVASLLTLPNGDLLIGGLFSSIGAVTARGLARFDGISWSEFGGGLGSTSTASASLLALLPDGDVLVGGAYQSAGGVPASSLARWTGSSWQPLSLVPASQGSLASAVAIARAPNGDLTIGGSFAGVGGLASSSLIDLSTTCPAVASPVGAGCAGSGGSNVLTNRDLPWTGGTYRSVATGMPAVGIAVRAVGFAPVSIPLASLLAIGQPNCTLLATPDVLDLAVASAGAATFLLALPDTVALAGMQLHEQVVAFEMDANANLLAATATNALTLTIGTF